MNRSEIEAIIRKATVCRLALSDGNRPYVVPLCFGYEDGTLYFHSGPRGKKLDILRRNNNVCFEFDIDQEVVASDQACRWGMKYRSVIGFGQASFVDDRGEKKRVLAVLMRQYSDRSWEFPDDALDRTAVIKVDVESMTGKQAGY